MSVHLFFVMTWYLVCIILYSLDRCHFIPYPGFRNSCNKNRHKKPRLLIYAKIVTWIVLIILPLSFF